MKIAIRGEGSTDVGSLDGYGVLEKGPMIILIEKLNSYVSLLSHIGYTDGLNKDHFVEWIYVHKDKIKNHEKRKFSFRSKKNSISHKGFYNNGDSFGYIANENKADLAIFFVDSDNDQPEDRYEQVKEGLVKHKYDKTGIPMIPVKISESWLLCHLNNYQNCVEYENSTSDKLSPSYPKTLCDSSGKTRHEIAEECDPNKINMPSFNKFREDLILAINSFAGYDICS